MSIMATGAPAPTSESSPAATEPSTTTAETSAKDVVTELAENISGKEATSAQEVVAPKPEENAAAAKFAALSRREKAIKAQEKALAEKVKAMEARMQEIEGLTKDETKYISAEEFKKNPYKYMKNSDIKLETLAELALNDGVKTPETMAQELEAKLEAKVKAMEAKLAEKEAKEEQERIEAALHGFKTQLTEYVNTAEDYELIRATDSVELVYEVIEQHCEATIDPETGKGIVLSNKEACDMVEKYLLDQEKARIEKYRNLNKIKGMLEPSTQKVEQTVKEPSTNTLTNTLASQVPNNEGKKLTPEESLREAAKLLKWNS